MNKKGRTIMTKNYNHFRNFPLQIVIENVKKQTKEQNQAIGHFIHSNGNMSISV